MLTSKDELGEFLGMVNYFKNFIQGLSEELGLTFPTETILIVFDHHLN